MWSNNAIDYIFEMKLVTYKWYSLSFLLLFRSQFAMRNYPLQFDGAHLIFWNTKKGCAPDLTPAMYSFKRDSIQLHWIFWMLILVGKIEDKCDDDKKVQEPFFKFFSSQQVLPLPKSVHCIVL